MGHKTHPIGFRLKVIKSWQSKWFAKRDFPRLLQEDLMIRAYIKRRLKNAEVSTVEITRTPKKVTINLHTARPGVVIGRKGVEVEKLKGELQHLVKREIMLNILEIKRPELDAQLVSENIARQLEGRVFFRRAMKKAVASAMRMGAAGFRIACKGRLGGAEMSRKEEYKEGRVPLHTLRADIDYGEATAHTTYGCIGVKVWICKGEILPQKAVPPAL